MRRSRRWRLSRSLLALVLLAVVGCGNGNKRLGADSDGSTASYVSRFGVDTSKCQDELVDGHLGTIVPIGTTMPLSGGPAKAFAPLAAGLEAYVAYANERGLLGDHTLQLTVEDDQLNPQLTRPAVLKLIEFNRVALLTGMVGTESNLAMRDLLNKECYPQLFANSASPALGDVERSPWTSGGVAPANTETAIYVHDMQARFPNGATVALFGVNRELGSSYVSALERLAAGAKLQVVDEQTIDSGDSGPPTAQVTSIAAKRPDVILAAPLGDQCPTFLTAIGRARAADASWQPRIYLTASCASAALLGRAGGDADGVITATALKDVNDPALANDAAVKDLRGALVGTGFPPDGDFATAAVGWTQMEATVEVLINAAASSGGLTRASIINAARDLTFTPSLARAGVSFVTIGAADPFVLESLQLVRFDASRGGYSEVGPLVTEFEGKSERSS
jgi:branched-chain amino acid transport system substrate-binding protein